MITEVLQKYYDEGWLIKQIHPTKDLTIWNYSRKTQWEDHWDEITLMCRGLVTNSEGRIVSRCFQKFFNWEQLVGINYQIPNEPFDITEKMDGQFGNFFHYDNEWIITSRGSFTSIYAVRAKELLRKYDYTKLSTEYTYLFEIIFKEGRIVCKYDFEDLIMLARIHIESGEEKTIYGQGFEDLGFKLVKKYDGINDFDVLKSMISDDAEGFVLRFKSGFRMKIKGAEYCRLHSIVTNISSRDIWRHLKEGKPIDELLENVPDEFDKWVKNQVKMFNEMFDITKTVCQLKYLREINPSDGMSRKEVAMKILSCEKNLRPIFFHIYDGRDYSGLIWEKLYPPYSKPFNNNDDNTQLEQYESKV